jgi:hypothetical protein
MAAFDKILSGNASLDEALDFIRLGDNVVWQVSDLEEFRFFVEPFVKQAIADGRNLNYIRFAQHEPLLQPMEGLKIHTFDPDQGFEAFTVAIYNRVKEEGIDAFYVFDSLSELQAAWYTDLMMGNFFQVTCPYLFILDTVAYFPLLRGKHSFDAVAKIRDTTQLLMDVYSDEDMIYLHPLKVWKRYSNRMFLPHHSGKDTFDLKPLEGGVAMSRYYRLLEDTSVSHQDQNYDSYDRFFAMAKMEYAQGAFREETENLILESTMTKDKRMQGLLKQFFTPNDYFALRNRMIGSGAIGGKACGMLLARKVIHKMLPDYKRLHREAHDSFYIASDVFYTYIVENHCWNIRVMQRTKEGYFAKAEELRDALLSGEFPTPIREKFRTMLQYFGQSPIIVRSSSFLEDGFGNAFAGKYESVFCVNQESSPEKRLRAFEAAVRQVYASIMDISALEYRLRRGLHDKDEQMAILVQRVSGSYFGHYFMPCAAGVGYSHSAYKWRSDMDPAAGMLRIVMGLGTRAVDRTENDYPRLVNLDHPSTTMMTTVAQKHRFSQRKVDVLDEQTNALREISLEELLPVLPLWYKRVVLEHDTEAERTLRGLGRPREVWFASCQKLLERKEFTDTMQSILKSLEQVYGNPVDIEYTVNFEEKGDFVINLLQCRPLYTGSLQGKLELPQLRSENIFFDLVDSSMGSTGVHMLDAVILIDPRKYYEYPHNLKPQVAVAVGKINTYYKNQPGSKAEEGSAEIDTSDLHAVAGSAAVDMSDLHALADLAAVGMSDLHAVTGSVAVGTSDLHAEVGSAAVGTSDLHAVVGSSAIGTSDLRSEEGTGESIPKKVLLMTPGRIGTSSPELGVPVRFADISGFSGICEVSDSRAGYMPELSYGSHMFQDLVEAEIVYCAVWNNEKTRLYQPDLLTKLPNRFAEIVPDMPELADMIWIAEPKDLYLWQDSLGSRALCGYLN